MPVEAAEPARATPAPTGPATSAVAMPAGPRGEPQPDDQGPVVGVGRRCALDHIRDRFPLLAGVALCG